MVNSVKTFNPNNSQIGVFSLMYLCFLALQQHYEKCDNKSEGFGTGHYIQTQFRLTCNSWDGNKTINLWQMSSK